MSVITTLTNLPYSLADLPLFMLLPALLVASGFFSGSETAMFSLTAQNRLRLTRRGGVVGTVVQRMLGDMQLLLITLMLGNMTINVLYFVVSSALLLKLDPSQHAAAIAVGSILPLVAIIVFGEVVPKMVANLSPVRWVRITALPLFAVHRAIGPLRIVLRSAVIAPLGRLLAPPRRPPALNNAELESLIDLSKRRGVIDHGEEQVVREVVSLSRLKVRDIMTPRVDIEAVPIDADPADVHALIVEHRYTKIPVYRGDMDNIEGVIYARQFLLARGAGRAVDLSKLVRQVRFVPELQRVDQLLEVFRKGRAQVAIAVDEFGGTAGLVTIKDVVERLVGRVDFEPGDRAAQQTPVEPLGPGRWRVGGGLPVADWAQTFGTSQIPPRVATLGGLVSALLGRIPQVGDTARLGNVTLEVAAVDAGRVESVILATDTPDEGADA